MAGPAGFRVRALIGLGRPRGVVASAREESLGRSPAPYRESSRADDAGFEPQQIGDIITVSTPWRSSGRESGPTDRPYFHQLSLGQDH